MAFRKLAKEPAGNEPASANENGIDATIKEREADIPKIYLIKEFIRKSSSTGALMNYLYKTSIIKYLPPPDRVANFGRGADFEATEYYLDQIDNFLSDKDSKLVLLIIVPLVRFDAYPYNELNERLREYALSRDTLFVNPLEEFSKSNYPSGELWVSMKDSHYNVRANRVISEVLKKALTEHCSGT